MSSLDERYGAGAARRLADVVALCRRAEQMGARGRGRFDGDPDLDIPKLAADSIVLKLGEAVRRLPDAFLEERRGDPEWRRAIGMRHRLAHEYDAVDYELVWAVLTRHAGELRERVEDVLREK